MKGAADVAQGSITIEDVAKASGVSRQTVSRVINHAANVSASARERVDAAIAELGYVPNLAARRMGGARSYVLLALVARGQPTPLPLGKMLLAGIEACAQAGYHLMFEQFEAVEGAECTRRLNPVLGAMQPDGVIILPPLDDSATLIAALEKRGIAFTCLGEKTEFGRAVPGLDEATFAQTATQKLIDFGHRQVGLVTSAGDTARSQRRVEGYRRALTSVRSRVHRHFVAAAPADFPSALQLARTWLTPTIRPTAILAESADAALAFRQAAEELAVTVPRDLSILALEDAPALEQANPAISAMELPYDALFAQACKKLACQAPREATADDGEADQVKYVERMSVAKAPRLV